MLFILQVSILSEQTNIKKNITFLIFLKSKGTKKIKQRKSSKMMIKKSNQPGGEKRNAIFLWSKNKDKMGGTHSIV